MKNTFLLLALSILTFTVQAQPAPEKIQKDGLQIGRASSLLPKELIFDSGDGASNKKLSLDPNDNNFDLNSSLSITGAMDATGAISGASSSVTGSSVHQSGITLGSGTDASKQITVDRAGFDPFMKWNETTGKWVYSNDGSVEKNIGSGSGGEGGVNILLNPSFEDGIAVDWSNSGGTFTSQTYTNPDPNGNDSVYARFVASGAGQYFETALHAVPDFSKGGCLAKVNFNTSDAANWKLQAYDSSANLLREETLYVKSWQDGFASFACPTSGTTIKLRVISIAAGQIEVDKAYLGKENRTFKTSEAKLLGTLKISGCSSNHTTAAGMWQQMGTNTGCSYVASGIVQAPATQVAGFRLPYVEKGNLKVVARGGFGKVSTTTNTDTFWMIKDLTNAIDGQNQMISFSAGSGGALSAPEIGGLLNYSSRKSSTSSFEIYGGTSAGGAALAAIFTGSGVVNASNPGLYFEVWHFPDDTQTALVPEAQDWMIDANIGGGNPLLFTITSYTEANHASLDMVLNSGSASAKIPCTGSNAAVGLTCSGGTTTESVGVNFISPTPGFYEACAYGALGIPANAGSTVQWVETTNASQTIIQEGKSKTTHTAPNSASVNMPIANCGTFYFSSAGERTLRLMYEGTAGGSGFLIADRDASNGQRDIHIIVRPLLSAYNRPYSLEDATFKAKSVVSPGVTKPVLVSAVIAAAGTVSNELVDFLNGNCTNSTSAVCSFNGGFWASAPNCWVESNGGSNLMANFAGNASTSSVTIVKQDLGSVAFNHITTLFCHGPANNQ